MVVKRSIPVFFLLMASVASVPCAVADSFDDAFNRDITKGFFDEKPKAKGKQSPFTDEQIKAASRVLNKAQQKIEREMQTQQADFQLYLQMQKVDNWLTQWTVWNHSWPTYVMQVNEAVIQLSELVPNNPYQPGQLQESSGRSTDPNYRYLNQPLNQFYHGEAADGFQPDSFVPNNSYEAYGRKKIRLEYNPSLTAEEVREWEYNPPDSWKQPPGTITGISNGQNLIVVWGAGFDGRPIKVPGNRKKIRMFVSNILMSGSTSNY